METRKIYYWSFVLGKLHTSSASWEHDDIKIPGTDLKEAVYLYYFHQIYMARMDKPWPERFRNVRPPDLDWVRSKLKQVIKYERVENKPGVKASHRFKKIEVIPAARVYVEVYGANKVPVLLYKTM